jgi:tetratricopeptide (TPR) repeat protein
MLLRDSHLPSAEIDDGPAAVAAEVDGWNASAVHCPRSTFVAASLIVLAAAAVFANSFRGDFVYDDLIAIVNNSTIRSLWPLAPVLSPPLDGATVAGRPLLNLSLAVNYYFGGEKPWGYHVVNLVIHTLAALLLFGILRRSFRLPALRDRWGGAATLLALVIALMWAVHPLQTESVTYVVQRAESGFGLLYLLVLYCVIRGATQVRGVGCGVNSDAPRAILPTPHTPHPTPHKSNPALWYFAAIVGCLLGMSLKEAMVSVPLFVLLYDRTLLSGSFRQALRRRWGLYLGLLATEGLLAYLVATMSLAASRPRPGVTAWRYACAQPRAVLHYLRLCFWPWPLCLDTWPPVLTKLSEMLPGLIVLGLLLAVTLVGLWRRKSWGLPGAWFFLILAPSSSVVPLWNLSAEHRMYLPLAAVLTVTVLSGYGVYGMLRRRSPSAGRVAAVAFGSTAVMAVAALAFGTVLRNADYRDMRIWQDTVDKAPWNPEAQFMYGARLGLAGRTDEAILHLEKAVALNPRHVEARDDLANLLERQGKVAAAMSQWSEALQYEPANASANYNYALALQRQGRLDEAVAHYENAIAVKPRDARVQQALAEVLQRQGKSLAAIAHYEKALQIEPASAEVHNNLGALFLQQRKLDDAMAHFERAAAIDPKNVDAQINLGNVSMLFARPQRAIPYFQRALAIEPHCAEAHFGLAGALGGLGKIPEAIAHYEQALAVNPRFAPAHYALAEVLEQQGQPLPAIAHYEKALEIAPAAADVHISLGALFVRQRKFDDAMAHFERAAAIDPKNVAAEINMGNVFVQLARPERAIPYLQKALAIDPHCAEAHNALAGVLHGLGRLQESIVHWRQALAARPQYPEACYNLGQALFENGQAAEGRAQLRALEEMRKNGEH